YAKSTDIKETTIHSIELSDLSDSTLSKTAKSLIGKFN
ncbi:MAG TPA: tRNA 2-selenouridine(34) synthase MnmH, partial [Rhodobacteraceae bacterium]|nr:tRNA 2-selenouridine(34) synthase MnmH [Paracoccaceae bacterium]